MRFTRLEMNMDPGHILLMHHPAFYVLRDPYNNNLPHSLCNLSLFIFNRHHHSPQCHVLSIAVHRADYTVGTPAHSSHMRFARLRFMSDTFSCLGTDP